MVFRLFMLFLQHSKQFVDVKNNKGKQMRTKRIVLLMVCGMMAFCSHAQTQTNSAHASTITSQQRKAFASPFPQRIAL